MKGIQERCSELSHLAKSKNPDLETLTVYQWIRRIILEKGYNSGENYVRTLINENRLPNFN